MDTSERIAEALERIASAHEALVLLAQALLTEEEPAAPGTPQTIMTQHGPIELR